MSTFLDKLKKEKENLKDSSVQTYNRNIKRLRKVLHELPVPVSDHKWVNSKKLVSWWEKEPLNVRRHMATAAVVALQVYGKDQKAWKKRQQDSMKEFDEKRKTRTLTEAQKKMIPQKGFDSLKKVAANMKRELSHVLKKKTEEWTKTDLQRVQDLLIISLYHNFPLRLDYATLKVGKTKTNCIYKNTKKPRGWHIQLVEFKTEKSLGAQTFKPNAANQRLLNLFIPVVGRLTDHGFLLSNKSGGKMTKQVLSKRLISVTKKRIGKGFSVQFLRILYAMQNRKVLETAKEVSKKLMHSPEQSLMYSKKN